MEQTKNCQTQSDAEEFFEIIDTDEEVSKLRLYKDIHYALLESIVEVQPMSGPSGLIFTIK